MGKEVHIVKFTLQSCGSLVLGKEKGGVWLFNMYTTTTPVQLKFTCIYCKL